MASLVKEAGEVDVDQGNKVANNNTLTISIPSTGSRKKHSSGGNIFYRMVFPMKYTYYNVQIQITGSSNKTFTVERRYSEFYILHRLLRRKFSMVKTLSFPSKKFFVWSNLSKATVEERRAAFTTYLEQLIKLHPRPFDLNRFLSLSDHMSTNYYHSSQRVQKGRKSMELKISSYCVFWGKVLSEKFSWSDC